MRHFFILICLNLLVFSLSAHDLVDLRQNLPEAVYHCDKIYVHRHVASRLKRVQQDLATLGLGLIVFEGYRPPSEEQFPDENVYSKGTGIDVSIYYLNDCHLAMPTEYGDDSPRARRDYIEHPAHVFHNCWILEKHMIKYGFESQIDNWWHFNLKGWDCQEDLNMEYSDLYSPNYCDVVYQKFMP
jgi:D-alanyl-D-alanine dipeptidase